MLLKSMPSSHKKDIKSSIQMGMKDYTVLTKNILKFANDIRFEARSKDDMDCSTVE